MEDIDVTKKLRPQKTPVSPSQNPPPPAVSAPAGLQPPLSSAKSAISPSLVIASPDPAPPPPADMHTIRFAVGTPTADVSAHPPAHEPDPVTGWLVVVKGMGRGRSLPLGYGIHAVGRAEDQRVPVRFGDKKVSRRNHIEISYDGKGRAFYIVPGRGSTLGYLNGQPVLQPSLLRAGDRISVGDTELMFVPFCGESFDWQQSE